EGAGILHPRLARVNPNLRRHDRCRRSVDRSDPRALSEPQTSRTPSFTSTTGRELRRVQGLVACATPGRARRAGALVEDRRAQSLLELAQRVAVRLLVEGRDAAFDDL